jgi:hypothetical protein
MQKQIDEAIAKGAAWLRKQQGGDGGFGSLDFGGNPHYQQGLASLTGLALVAAGDTKDDPWMKALVEFAKKRDATEASGSVRTTYGTGVLIMFLTELYRNKPGKTDARYATKKKEGCGLPKDIASWIQELASWIVSVQLDDGWWRYPHTPPSDLSNTQYALLGLRAARDCGADVPLSRFVVALERCLATQQQDGKKLVRVIPPDNPGEKSYSVDRGDRARGWSYRATHDADGHRQHDDGRHRRARDLPDACSSPRGTAATPTTSIAKVGRASGTLHVARRQLGRRLQPAARGAGLALLLPLRARARGRVRGSDARRRARLVPRGGQAPVGPAEARGAVEHGRDRRARDHAERPVRHRVGHPVPQEGHAPDPAHPRAGRHDGQMTVGPDRVPPESEASLVAACAAGDADAWARFVPRFGPLVAALARRMLARRRGVASDADVDEVTGGVFLALVAHDRKLLHRYRPEFRLSTYLGVICRTEVGRLLRRAGRTVSLEGRR